MTSEQPRMLVVRLSSLGDILHVLPAVHAIKRHLGATVDWVTQPEYGELVRCFTDVEDVIAFHRRSFFRTLPRFARALRARRYELVLDFHGIIKSGVTAGLARGGKKIGPSFWAEGARVFYSAVAGSRDPDRHAVDQHMDMARYLGVADRTVEFPVELPEWEWLGERRWQVSGVRGERHADRAPVGAGASVAILPVSRWASKNWPVSSFVELTKRLHAELDGTLYVLGAAADQATCAQLERAAPDRLVNLCGKTSLVELGALLKRMDLLIANDSGPIHIAAAVGTPVLALFGPTDPTRTGPYGDGNRVLQSYVPCRTCYARQCRRGDVKCLADIAPSEVLEAALGMVAGNAERGARNATLKS